MAAGELRVCSRCSEVLPNAREYFCLTDNRCKQCLHESRLIRLAIRGELPTRRMSYVYLPGDQTKCCSRCARRLPATVEFFRVRNGHFFSWCRECVKKYTSDYKTKEKWKSAWHAKYKFRDRWTRYLREFGLSRVSWETLFSEQRGVCAICESAPPKGLVVDHSHDTGAVRGLLCDNCNVGLGRFFDSPDLLRRALGYLLRHLQQDVA